MTANDPIQNAVYHPCKQGAVHIWAMDITYIPMARGFVYLAAVID